MESADWNNREFGIRNIWKLGVMEGGEKSCGVEGWSKKGCSGEGLGVGEVIVRRGGGVVTELGDGQSSLYWFDVDSSRT